MESLGVVSEVPSEDPGDGVSGPGVDVQPFGMDQDLFGGIFRQQDGR